MGNGDICIMGNYCHYAPSSLSTDQCRLELGSEFVMKPLMLCIHDVSMDKLHICLYIL